MRFLKFVIVMTLTFKASIGYAEDLAAIYQLAQVNDPTIQAAREALLAAKEACPQARALFLPIIGASASNTIYNRTYNANTVNFLNQTAPLTPNKFNYDQSVYGLTLSQPIFYYQQWVQLDKASEQVKQSNAVYAAAEQDLIVRTIQSYFGVLRANDIFQFTKSQREAFAKYLEQTQQMFKAGILPLTDVQIAKAKHDNALAQEIAAKNNIDVQKQQLEQITGFPVEKLSFLRDSLDLKSPEPNNMEEWIDRALAQNFNLQAVRYLVQSTREDIKLNQANHLPVVSLNGAVTTNTATKDILALPRNSTSNIGVQMTIPLFNGGSVVSKTRQARHIFEQTQQQMEATYRQVKSSTSQAYLGVITQLGQISALKQAIVSNQTALEATDASFKQGLRTIVDVLTAESDLVKSRQDHANARYDYILQSILLKQAAGTLCPADIDYINCWLKT